MAIVLTIYNFKGGVGKTTTTYQLAKHFSKQYNVLVIDCDPQTNLSTLFLRVPSENNNLYTQLRNLIHNRPDYTKPIAISPSLSIIAGSSEIISLESNNQFVEFGNLLLRNLIHQLEADYDIILLDCPSYFGKTVQYLLSNSTHILIPLTPDVFSIKGAIKLIKSLRQIKPAQDIKIVGAFFNRFQTNAKYHRKIQFVAKRIFGQSLISQTVSNSSFFNVTQSEKTKDGLLPASGKTDQDFYRLFLEIKERVNLPPKARKESEWSQSA